MLNKNTRRGFTLIEVLIVVVLLGILASIAIPQFNGTTNATRKAALADQLHGLRAQIQLYMVQHEQSPNLSGSDWDALMTPSTSPRGTQCGPYLHSVPLNVLNKHSNIAVVAADPKFGDAVAGANIGFIYNPNTGLIWGTNSTGNRVFNEADPDDPNN